MLSAAIYQFGYSLLKKGYSLSSDDPKILYWGFLISDYGSTVWYYSLWVLLKRMWFVPFFDSCENLFSEWGLCMRNATRSHVLQPRSCVQNLTQIQNRMSAVVNFTDGSLNAGLSIAFQVIDVFMLLFLRPFNSFKTELTEDLGGITNLCTFLLITFPILSELELPVWIGDLTRIALAVLATAVAAVASIIEPARHICNALLLLVAKLSGCSLGEFSCLTCLYNKNTSDVHGTAAYVAVNRASMTALSNTQVFLCNS